MNANGVERPDVARVLNGLKDFQRKTVEYTFQRLYGADDPVSRFLVADEVGLGKTLVARGVIAKAVDHLWERCPRIDIVYICSNLEIAQQNINRLNVLRTEEFKLASRATLLPITIKQLKGRKLNFVSLTPGTSFNLQSSTGTAYERVLLYFLILGITNGSDSALSNLLRVDVTRKHWSEWVDWFQREKLGGIDSELRAEFLKRLQAHPTLLADLNQLTATIGSHRKYVPDELRIERTRLVGALREMLAKSSLSALEPDLIILDEFQRFKYLLNADDPLSMLARELFNASGARVLLLSATPYKMYTLQGEQDEDHFKDFQTTAGFLLEKRPQDQLQLTQALEHYRREVFHAAGSVEFSQAKEEVEAVLRRVMVRTERLSVSADRNGMLRETRIGDGTLEPADIRRYVGLDRVASLVQAGDQLEYWKSSAYPLNLMDTYNLKRRLKRDLEDPTKTELAGQIAAIQADCLSWEQISHYQVLDPGNARLRALQVETLDTGNWELLWMPPALPYYQADGPFQQIGPSPKGATKLLLFSSWQVAPKTVAMLLSYEAERRALGEKALEIPYDKLSEHRRPLLRFARSLGRLTGMSNFCLQYPCITLAEKVDPLQIAVDLQRQGIEPTTDAVRTAAGKIIQMLLAPVLKEFTDRKSRGPADESWYWAAPLMLDRRSHADSIKRWLETDDKGLRWQDMQDGDEKESKEGEDEQNRFADHVDEFHRVFLAPQPLGEPPRDLVETLAEIALASPAVCSLRSFLRMQSGQQSPELLAAAAQVALGFRSLFNQPESILLLQRLFPDADYWKAVLHYTVMGNLQSVMDEYVHILRESSGLMDRTAGDAALELGQKIRGVLSLRSPALRFDEFIIDPDTGRVGTCDRRIRCRYAMRIGEDTADEVEGRTRSADVREAFNSPFRPFVLASTSIGQEGLDFHQYCHRIMHWNLPSNPVDLEQREGRIHRYKGHVIRRNLAGHYGLAGVQVDPTAPDPWASLFALAQQERKSGENDLVPFWIYENGGEETYLIERILPILPFSREADQIERLKESLVLYRSLLGQPRQEELMKFLQKEMNGRAEEILSAAMIDLSPL